MKHLKWVVAIVLAIVVASAWFLVSRHTEKPVPSRHTEPQLREEVAAAPAKLDAGVSLTRLLPTGAVAVIHYTGGEALKPAFDQSALGQIFNDPQMQEFLRKPKQALYKGMAMATNGPRPEVTRQICRWFAGKESALAVYVQDKPQVAICVRLGADAPKARALCDDALKSNHSVSKRTFHGNEITVIATGQQQTIAKDVFVFASDGKTMDAVLERIDADAAPTETVTPPALEVGQSIGWAVVDIAQALQKGRAALKEPVATERFDAVVKELGVE
ncbi:MAG TPA: hypothetical protein VLZ30_12645, partial [Verrucomicrobiae bacterium]|nr:hypothetical protein [Verrucomicrobiae bacterium]